MTGNPQSIIEISDLKSYVIGRSVECIRFTWQKIYTRYSVQIPLSVRVLNGKRYQWAKRSCYARVYTCWWNPDNFTLSVSLPLQANVICLTKQTQLCLAINSIRGVQRKLTTDQCRAVQLHWVRTNIVVLTSADWSHRTCRRTCKPVPSGLALAAPTTVAPVVVNWNVSR